MKKLMPLALAGALAVFALGCEKKTSTTPSPAPTGVPSTPAPESTDDTGAESTPATGEPATDTPATDDASTDAPAGDAAPATDEKPAE